MMVSTPLIQWIQTVPVTKSIREMRRNDDKNEPLRDAHIYLEVYGNYNKAVIVATRSAVRPTRPRLTDKGNGSKPVSHSSRLTFYPHAPFIFILVKRFLSRHATLLPSPSCRVYYTHLHGSYMREWRRPGKAGYAKYLSSRRLVSEQTTFTLYVWSFLLSALQCTKRYLN